MIEIAIVIAVAIAKLLLATLVIVVLVGWALWQRRHNRYERRIDALRPLSQGRKARGQ